MRRAIRLFSLASVLVVALPPAHAQAQDALPWFHTYDTPGNYVVGGVDSVPLSAGGGLRTSKISMSGVPANAEILAALVYWETMWSGPDSTLDTLRGQVKFRGESVAAVASSSIPLSGNFAGCRGSTTGQTLTMMRADVLSLLPLQLDEHGEPTGRRYVNDSDLIANGIGPHTVTLPDSGNMNLVPQSAGASLLVVYQDPNPLAPLTSIVVYDGINIQAPGATTQLTIRGFVDAVNGAGAKLTYIAGSGGKNGTERVYFGGTAASLTILPSFDPFQGPGALRNRAWSNPTFNIPSGSWLPENDFNYGEQARTKVDHTAPLNTYDCLATAAVVFSTATQDGDGDGLPDKLETVAGLKNPDGVPYPDITGPADPTVRDLFVEIGAMKTAGHNHMPTPEVLRKVGDALANPPIGGPLVIPPIAVHFDVGDVATYHALGPEYASHEADAYILGVLYPGLARGGEQIEEQPSARFPGFSGVVSWPGGYQFLALEPVGPNGEEIAGPACDSLDPTCRRRFDPNRQGIFHYLLYAHARSAPKSEFPCLAPEPVEFPVGMTDCGVLDDNPDYYVPKSVSGVAELPGRYAMVSLGLWDNSLGTRDMQANTTLHELGHNLNLWHGGAPPVFTPTASGVHVFVQPNCRPNHVSIMSYLFQATGVRNAAGVAQTRLSGEVIGTINEQALFDGSLGLSPDAAYTSWYAPKEPGTLGDLYKLTPATKHCDGTPLGLADPAVGTVRLDAATPDALIDWAGNGALPEYPGGQDVNFDGKKSGEAASLVGYNDWNGIALNRLGAGHDVLELSLGLGLDFSGLDFSGLDFSGLDFSGLGLNGLDFSGLDFSGLDFSGLDFSGLDFSGLDFSGLEAEIDGELTYDLVLDAIAPGGSTGPRELKAFVRGTNGAGGTNSSVPMPGNWVPMGEPTTCATLNADQCHQIRLDWLPPAFGTPDGYEAFRVWDPTGAATEPSPSSVVDLVGTTAGATTTVVDDDDLPNGQRFIFWVQGNIGGDLGQLSNFAILPAKNDPPVANANAYTTNGSTALVVTTSCVAGVNNGVLCNDTDVDSGPASIKAVLVSGPSHGTLTCPGMPSPSLCADGSFTYTPNPGSATDSFTYKANNGTWCRGGSCVPMSPDSNEATVSITVHQATQVAVTISAPSDATFGAAGGTATAGGGSGTGAYHFNAGASTACTVGATSGVITVTSGTGTCVLTASRDGDSNYAPSAPSAPATVTIHKAASTTTFGAAPTPTYPGGNFTVSATNNSGGAITYSKVGGPCAVVNATAGTFSSSGVGTCTVRADSAATTNYLASWAQQNVTIATQTTTYQITITPLRTPTNLGSAVSIEWQLRDSSGNVLSSLSTVLKIESVFNGPASSGGCGAASSSGTKETLYNPATGATGASGLRFTGGGYKFNWDTTTAATLPIMTGRGCYTVLISLNDGSAPRMTTAVQLR